MRNADEWIKSLSIELQKRIEDRAAQLIKEEYSMDSNVIIKIIYCAIKAYAETVGDNSFADWEIANRDVVDSMYRGYLIRLNALRHGVVQTPEENHNYWMKDRLAHGWVLGPIKNDNKKEHPALVPYVELPTFQRVKNTIFTSIIDSFFQNGFIS